MGVGVQGEGCVGVSQDTGQGLGIHAAGQSVGSEGMPQVVEPNVGQARLLEQHFQSAVSRVRVRRQLWTGGMGEDPYHNDIRHGGSPI